MPETAQQYIQRILGHVDGQDAIKVQRSTAPKLKKLIHGLTPRQLKTPPEPGKWSIAEIVAHLADAEIVASWRMRSILGANGTTIQAFDQDAWASVFRLRQARSNSVARSFPRTPRKQSGHAQGSASRSMGQLRHARRARQRNHRAPRPPVRRSRHQPRAASGEHRRTIQETAG